MKVVVVASDEKWAELTAKRPAVEWLRVMGSIEFIMHKDADAFFNLMTDEIYSVYESLGKPVFIDAVTKTLSELNAPKNVYRVNGWNTFLSRQNWEVAGHVNDQTNELFNSLGITITVVADEPGLIAARIVSLIVNEAYLTVAEEVSSKTEIDTAMKLGTNYPYGPFEWAGVIGLDKILDLLTRLSKAEKRYQPAALLIQEVNDKR